MGEKVFWQNVGKAKFLVNTRTQNRAPSCFRNSYIRTHLSSSYYVLLPNNDTEDVL